MVVIFRVPFQFNMRSFLVRNAIALYVWYRDVCVWDLSCICVMVAITIVRISAMNHIGRTIGDLVARSIQVNI